MQHYILRLDIPMDNPQRVYLIHRLAHLPHNKRNPRLRQRLTLLQLVVQLPPRPHLQNYVNVRRVVETTVHLDYVRMVQKHLDLHLPRKLVSNLLLVQQLLLDHLQRTNKTTLFLTHQVHTTVLTVTQLL